jgi:hypothetical protein
MPEQSKQQDLAYHIFSVLSFFFDSRDDGACRYRWEERLLEYFGAGVTEEGASAVSVCGCRRQNTGLRILQPAVVPDVFFLGVQLSQRHLGLTI